jgi:CRP/FNR family transcriptional regulator
MAIALETVQHHLPNIGLDLQQAIAQAGVWKEFPAQQEIMEEGQPVKMIPVVVSGLLKVFTRYEEKELLLYYIQPRESCVMSFLAGLKNQPSRVFAMTEESTQVILLPAQQLEQWTRDYPRLNALFYDLYNQRYSELIDTLQQLIFQSLDSRLYDYLREQSRLKNVRVLDLRHRKIAQDLGTSREVITRVLKRLEKEKKVRQTETGIEIL